MGVNDLSRRIRKMNSAMEEIFFGDVRFTEKTEMTEEYKRLLSACAEVSGRLTRSLTGEDCENLEELILLNGEMEAEAVKAYFISGFRLGMKTAYELKE